MRSDRGAGSSKDGRGDGERSFDFATAALKKQIGSEKLAREDVRGPSAPLGGDSG